MSSNFLQLFCSPKCIIPNVLSNGYGKYAHTHALPPFHQLHPDTNLWKACTPTNPLTPASSHTHTHSHTLHAQTHTHTQVRHIPSHIPAPLQADLCIYRLAYTNVHLHTDMNFHAQLHTQLPQGHTRTFTHVHQLSSIATSVHTQSCLCTHTPIIYTAPHVHTRKVTRTFPQPLWLTLDLCLEACLSASSLLQLPRGAGYSSLLYPDGPRLTKGQPGSPTLHAF